MTQRDDDTGQVEAKVKAQKLFDEWSAAYQGKRAGAKDGSNPGFGDRGSEAEDRNAPETFGGETQGPGPTPY